VGWMASGSYCVPGSDKAPAAIPKSGWCPAGGARAAASLALQARSTECQPVEGEPIALRVVTGSLRHAVLASTNKSPAKINKSREVAEATNQA
jgi:hypothetical protein